MYDDICSFIRKSEITTVDPDKRDVVDVVVLGDLFCNFDQVGVIDRVDFAAVAALKRITIKFPNQCPGPLTISPGVT